MLQHIYIQYNITNQTCSHVCLFSWVHFLVSDSSGTGVDGWVAAQCLAIEGEATQTVIERLLSQLFLSNAPSDREQAATLLVSISNKTVSDFCVIFSGIH